MLMPTIKELFLVHQRTDSHLSLHQISIHMCQNFELLTGRELIIQDGGVNTPFTLGSTTVVPSNENGDRRCGDWNFYCDEYFVNGENLKKIVCTGSNSENPLQDSRSGKLDVRLLKRHGLTIK